MKWNTEMYTRRNYLFIYKYIAKYEKRIIIQLHIKYSASALFHMLDLTVEIEQRKKSIF